MALEHFRRTLRAAGLRAFRDALTRGQRRRLDESRACDFFRTRASRKVFAA